MKFLVTVNTVINHVFHCVMITVVGNGYNDLSSNPKQSCCISHNTLSKGMNPIIFPPVMGK